MGVAEKKRVVYLDILRIIACIAVVVLHTASMQLWQTEVNSNTWVALIIYDDISRFGVPVFVMISGALLLDNSEGKLSQQASINENDNREWPIILRRIIRIVAAFAFWSAIYAAYDTVHYHLNIFGVITAFIKGPVHLWFLFMIAGLYLIIPILKLIANSKYVSYFLILGVVFNFVLPFIVWLSGLFSLRVQEIIEYPINSISFSLTKGYAFYFVLGHWLKDKEISRKMTGLICTISLIGFILTVGGAVLLARREGALNDYFYDNSSIGVGLEALGVFVLIKSLLSKKQLSQKASSVLSLLSKSTFGIYLIHVLILYFLDAIGISAISGNTIIMVPITALITLVLSFGGYFLLSRIPLIRKYII